MFVGADGCKRGRWLAVILTENGNWDITIFDDIRHLWEKCSNADLILLDVPIGLRESGTEERLCDVEARKQLNELGSRRGSSVFPAPCRAAVHKENGDEPSEINRKLTGRRLSLQSLNIIPYIRQVDRLLQEDKAARSLIREVHPEICFWAFNNSEPMQCSKKRKCGREQRTKVLESVFPKTRELIDEARRICWGKKVATDDILDALAAAITARAAPDGLLTIPETPEVDSRGLPMEMVYRLP